MFVVLRNNNNNKKKILEQVNEVVYLGSMFSRDGRYEMDVERRIAAGKVNGALAALMRRRNVSTAARLAVHNAVSVPTLLYGSETWILQKKNERRLFEKITFSILEKKNCIYTI